MNNGRDLGKWQSQCEAIRDVEAKETGRLPRNTRGTDVCGRFWKAELGSVGECYRKSISALTEEELSPS